jgi:hypothetical protein
LRKRSLLDSVQSSDFWPITADFALLLVPKGREG